MRRPSVKGLLPRRGASVFLVGLVATLFWVLVVSSIADFRYEGDIRALLCVGEETHHPAAFDTVPTAGPWGYDGQQYAALATDPFLRQPDTVKALDSPSYRATRVMVPLLAWLLAAGNAATALVAYQLLCWGLGLGSLLLIARWLADEGLSPWWALLLVTSTGLAAAIIRTTPDAAALLFMLAALWLHARNRPGLALVLACAAVLARETSYLVALAVALDEIRRRRFSIAAAFASVPLALLVGWQFYLRSVLGSAFATGVSNFSVPFVWVPKKLPTVFTGGGIWWMELLGLCAVAATVVAMIVVATRPSAWSAPELAFLAFGTMGLFLSYNVYCETWAYARALVPVPFLAVVIAGRQPDRLRRWVLLSVPLFYLLSGAAMTRSEVHDALEGRTLLAALRGEPPRSEARSTGATPGVPAAQGRPLYVLPVANAGGRAGAEWKTTLELANLAPIENRITLVLVPGRKDAAPRRKTLILEPGQTLSWPNAVGELFSFGGSGALRVEPRFAPVVVRSLTENVAAGESSGALLPALTDEDAIRVGRRARLAGLVHDPAPAAAVRTNIGLLNLAQEAILVRVEAFGTGERALGHLEQSLGPGEFVQIDNVYAKVDAGRVTSGSAVVQTPSLGGVFLAYASVIRGRRATATYVFPENGLRATAPARN
ncbi:MAG TPA: hypothetical protein VMT45_14300 [Thermoanaerobaculaceae bacterium]|nr:hypothetical protein [Thermoanaerobaculaceae bacterium]